MPLRGHPIMPLRGHPLTAAFRPGRIHTRSRRHTHVAYLRDVLKFLFVVWLLTLAAGMSLSVRGTKQDHAKKRALGRLLLLVAMSVVLVVLGLLTYTVAVSGRGS